MLCHAMLCHATPLPCYAVLNVCAQEDEEAGVGSGARLGSGGARRRMLRRNSVSMILENPVLAQVCPFLSTTSCVSGLSVC